MSKSGDKDQDPKLSPEEQLRMENEIEKLKLSAFNDAQFFTSEELPPEIESEWLKYIAHFEKDWEDVERITITEKLEHPQFPAPETLTEREIEDKLEEVQQRMADEGIFLDTICKVPAAEVYRFITEELFLEEIDDVDIEGMQTVFIYEEFYPNDELDIEQTITDFMLQMGDSQFHDYLHTNVAEQCENAKGNAISGETAVEKAIAFSNLYDQLELGHITNLKFTFNEHRQRAQVTFNIAYQAISKQKTTNFEGKATATLCKGKLGYWNISSFEIPGFTF